MLKFELTVREMFEVLQWWEDCKAMGVQIDGFGDDLADRIFKVADQHSADDCEDE